MARTKIKKALAADRTPPRTLEFGTFARKLIHRIHERTTLAAERFRDDAAHVLSQRHEFRRAAGTERRLRARVARIAVAVLTTPQQAILERYIEASTARQCVEDDVRFGTTFRLGYLAGLADVLDLDVARWPNVRRGRSRRFRSRMRIGVR